MLTRVGDGPSVVACSSCRRGADAQAGARLVAALRTLQAGDAAYAGILVQAMPCLFACAAACTVHIRAPERIGYVLGGFVADAAAARAILDYAVHHAASADGEVRFEDWPEGVKGHFLVRTPPAGYVID